MVELDNDFIMTSTTFIN